MGGRADGRQGGSKHGQPVHGWSKRGTPPTALLPGWSQSPAMPLAINAPDRWAAHLGEGLGRLRTGESLSLACSGACTLSRAPDPNAASPPWRLGTPAGRGGRGSGLPAFTSARWGGAPGRNGRWGLPGLSDSEGVLATYAQRGSAGGQRAGKEAGRRSPAWRMRGLARQPHTESSQIRMARYGRRPQLPLQTGLRAVRGGPCARSCAAPARPLAAFQFELLSRRLPARCSSGQLPRATPRLQASAAAELAQRAWWGASGPAMQAPRACMRRPANAGDQGPQLRCREEAEGRSCWRGAPAHVPPGSPLISWKLPPSVNAS